METDILEGFFSTSTRIMIYARQNPCQEPHHLGILLDALDVVNQ